MICPGCQTENPEENKVCLKCGAILPTQVSPPSPVAPSPVKLKILIIFGLALLLGVAVLGFLFLGNKMRKPPTTPTPSPLTGFPGFLPPTEKTTTKYDLDANGDAIPDFVEEALDWDPKTNPCVSDVCGEAFAGTIVKKATNLLFILDSSGSMAEKVSSGKSKIEEAKTVLKGYIDRLPSNIQVALMVYGHKGSNSLADKQLSCEAVETLYPLGSLNREQFKLAVDSFQPTGWTPIAGAFKQAAATVFTGREEDNNFILLVSDGEETCGGNPCQVAEELKKAKIQTTIDVVGFKVDQKAKDQLSCIAQVTGGKYFDAQTYDELREAFKASNERLQELNKVGWCLFENFKTYGNCLSNRWLKAQSYLTGILDEVVKKNYKDPEIKQIRAAQERMSQFYSIQAKTNIEQYQKLGKENLDQYLQEMNNWR
ncbi:VWA domain-containing protein [Candidatus Gottesmanbacteria bacterium]|nr:VWA domain-containing protein [Candidatus Gottesmanbacteria bacterium]